jgi:hypothetical protein
MTVPTLLQLRMNQLPDLLDKDLSSCIQQRRG